MSDIEKFNSVKFNIRKALESQGSDITVDTPFEEYPKYVMGVSGGSGGGSGLPEITTETVEVVAEQTVSFSSGGGGGIYLAGIAGEFSIDVGDTLIVNWDGTPYTCVVAEFSGSPTWGNFSIEGAGADTGEPFLMGAMSGRGIEMETLSGGTHTIQIASEKTNYPDGSILIVENATWSTVPLSFYHTMVADGTSDADVQRIASDYLPIVVQALNDSLCFYFSNETESGGVVSRWYYGLNYNNGGFTQEDMYIEIAAGGVTTMHTHSAKNYWDDDWIKSGDTWVFDAK